MKKPELKTLQDINNETMNQAFQAMVAFGLAMMDLERQKQQRRPQKKAVVPRSLLDPDKYDDRSCPINPQSADQRV